ncbi:MAG: glycosyltransferase [Bacteroidetes bacterium]|nr:glycosyltransferase [Bacteroidota bacterium]
MRVNILLSGNPKISIITVVYNNKDNFVKTLECVRALDYPNFEYIVVDGGSTDGTLGIIKENSGFIAKYISEKDNGIYDAMNKGMKLASGDYVWFMNAGDEPAHPGILNDVFKEVTDGDVYYGDTEMIDADGTSYGKKTLKTPPEKLTWKKMINGMVVVHQSLIVRKSLCPDYDLQYKYISDIDWTIKVLKKSGKVVNIHLVLSRFLIGGYSRKNTIASLKERFRMLCTHFNFFHVLFNHILLSFKFTVYIIRKRKLL